MTTRKVLVVDDSKSARYALKMLLQKHNCEVEMVDSAEAALERAAQEDKLDAIFMDHLMPTMDGFQGLDALKANPKTAHIPVVMCTANDEPKYQMEATGKGALGILSKPGTPESLNVMLEKIDAASKIVPPAPSGGGGISSAGLKAEIQPLLDKMRSEIEHALTASFNEQITKLKAEMQHRENELAQALIQKIAKEVLPNMLRHGAEQIEQRIIQRLAAK